MFLVPMSHEDLRGRRWPLVTIAIIVLNVAVFAITYASFEKETAELGTTKVHILLVAANFPDVQMTPEVRAMVEQFQMDEPKLWERMKSSQRPIEDAFDAEMRASDEYDANAHMAALIEQLQRLESETVIARYAFFPSRATFSSSITSAFLHGGFLHIIFNMWFLWLAGTVLEDAYGRILYPIFYLLSGLAASWGHQLFNAQSIVPTIGASGCVAGLMGAFLVRNFKTKIDFAFVYWFFSLMPRVYKFKAPAWLMLPLWLGAQLLSATVVGKSGGVAYWAHIGGFAFGMVGALALRFTGIEKKMDQSIEAEVSWAADPRIVKATELMEAHKLDEALVELQQAIREKPNLVEAHDMLAQIYWRKQDMENYKQALTSLCHAHMQAKHLDEALQSYDDLTTAGGDKIAAADWVPLCRYLESKENWERAAVEYEKFAHAYPSDKLAVYSLVAAARLNLKKLERRDEAARLYREAAASPVPHLDWDDAIRRGLADATSGTPAAA